MRPDGADGRAVLAAGTGTAGAQVGGLVAVLLWGEPGSRWRLWTEVSNALTCICKGPSGRGDEDRRREGSRGGQTG